MITIKNIRNNKTNLLTIDENDSSLTILDLKKELEEQNNFTGRLVLCGKILDDKLKIINLKDIYKYWNGKLILI